MSEVKVNKISPRSGTDVQLGDSGDTITIPSGATLDTSNSTVTLPDGSVTNADLAGSISTDKLAGTINFKNIIINGDMSIAQRGTSTSGITGPGYFTVDRFGALITTMGTWTQSQDTDVPTGQGFSKSLKMACTTADASPASGDIVALRLNIIEGQNVQYLKFGTANAESLTLSFWVKSNKTGTYIISFYIANGGYQLGKTVTINSADTWEKKTITIAGDTAHNFTNDNSAQLYLTFYLGVGSARTSGTLPSTWTAYSQGDEAPGQTVNLADNTANYINITGVQLEAGTTASDFEFLPYDVNLARCYRYYFDTGSAVNQGGTLTGGFWFKAFNANEAAGYNSLPVTMRAAPSITSFDNSGTSGKLHRAAVGDVGTSITFGNVSRNAVAACNETGTFNTTNPNLYIGRIQANAEL